MDFERELNQMLDAMTARAGQRPNRIIMHPDTAQTMASFVNNMAGVERYVSRYERIPIILSASVEPNKCYLVQYPPRTDWWMQSPYTYEETRKSGEPDEIDEKSFLDILNAGEQ